MARQDITIQGTVFSLDAPYEEGYQLKKHEANALNGLLAENVRNNMASTIASEKLKIAGWSEERIKNAKTEEKSAAIEKVTLNDEQKTSLQEAIDKYATEYEFGVRVGGRAKDPLEREMEEIVVAFVDNQLKAKGFSPSKFKKEHKGKYEGLIARVLNDNRARIEEQAKARLEEFAKITGALGAIGDPDELPEGENGTTENGETVELEPVGDGGESQEQPAA
jgi:hypothetical protein